MKRLLLFLFFFVAFSKAALCQVVSGAEPNFIPPSPNAAALGKFGEVALNYNSGALTHSIPLLSLTEQGLTLPISASYYYTGFRPNEEYSTMGLGWSLQAGGVITRVVNGLSDEGMNGYLSTGSSVGNTMSTQQLFEIAHGMKDGQPDMFSFNFMGHRGKFYFGSDGQIHFVNKKKFNVTYEIDNSPNVVPNDIFTKFTVITEDGIKYIFDAIEFTNGEGTGVGGHLLEYKATSWYLTKIIGTKGEEINFTYTQQPINKKRIQGSYSEKRVLLPNQNSIGLSASRFYSLETYLTKITGSLWEVEFDYTERTKNVFGYTSYFKSLDRIRLMDKSQSPSVLVKSYEMTYVDDTYRHLIRSIQEKSADNKELKPHRFFYDDDYLNPAVFNRLSIDYWGYHNGGNNSTLLPDSGADREANYNSRIYSLGTLFYPTGGYTSFEKESNTISYIQDEPYSETQLVHEYYTFTWSYQNGAWVVTQDNNFTIEDDSQYSSHIFAEYGTLDPVHCRDRIDVPIVARTAPYTAADFAPSFTCLNLSDETNGELTVTVDLERHIPIGIGTSNPQKVVGGLRVKKTITDSYFLLTPEHYYPTTITYNKLDEAGASSGALNNNFITRLDIAGQYTNGTPFAGAFLYSGPISPLSLSPVQYSEVQETKPHQQKTNYFFTTYGDNATDDYGVVYATTGGITGFNDPTLFGPADSFDFLRGASKKTDFYNGTFLTQKEETTHQDKATLKAENGYYKTYAYYPEVLLLENTGGGSSYTHFLMKQYTLSSTYPRETRKEKTTYSPDGLFPVIEKKLFDYNTLTHLQPTKVRTYESDGNYHEIQTKYPLDYQGTPNLAPSLQQMITDNMVSYPIEITDNYYKNGVPTLVDAGVTTYQVLAGNTARPQWVLPYKTYGFKLYGNSSSFIPYSPTSNEVSSSSYRELLHYVAYDAKGNLSGLKVKQSSNLAYLWGYQYQKPIAVFRNATASQVDGALAAIGTNQTAIQSLTTPTTLQTTLASLQNTTTLQTAQMNYLTYHPIFGQVTEASPNALTVHYAFDGFGRLEQIKDHDNNLKKQFGYYYAFDNVTRAISGIDGNTNSTFSSTFRVAGATPTDVADENKAITEITYYDRLGDTEQRLSYRTSPLKMDMGIEMVETDSLRRIIKQTSLPASLSVNTGERHGYYTNKISGIYGDTPYSETIAFDNSKLGRPLIQVGVGNAWRSPTLKATTFAYASEGVNVPYYTVTTTGELTKTGSYPASSLYKNSVTDPQGHTQTEIKDVSGRIIQKIDGEQNTTHYIYDESNRLRAILQPEVYTLNLTTIAYNAPEWAKGVFFYEYDNKNRMTRKYIPSGGWSNYVYDKLDRVVLDQTAVQATTNQWSFTKYDVQGREIIKGELLNASPQATLQSSFDGVSTPYEVWQGSAYSSQSFPIGYTASDVKTINYYDQYDWRAASLAFDATSAYNAATYWSNAKGLLTGSRVQDPQTTTLYYDNVIYYDNRNRILQTYQTHHKGGSSPQTNPIITNYEYNFAGEVTKEKTIYKVNGQANTEAITWNEYDHVGRLLKIYHGINSSTPTEIVRLSYDEAGRLLKKKLLPNGTYYVGGIPDYINRPPNPNVGIDDVAKKAICLLPGTQITNTYSATIDPNGAAGTPISGLQTMDYRWHIRGGLRGINLDGSGNAMPNANEGDLFSYKLDYETAGQWDGNIGKQSWKNDTEAQRSYLYTYDPAKRLKTATYTGVGTENYSLPNMSYDKNGNILNLQRKGSLGGSTYDFIDNLTYHYGTAGNQLQGVTDDVNGNLDVGDFRDNGSSNDYTYWADGSLKSDANKAISLIEYDTFLKKVKQVNWNDGRWLKFFYDGSGKLLKRQNSMGDYWEYVGAMVFKNGVPYQLTTPEGRAVYTNGTWNYEFEYRDHQNNLRVAFKAENGQLVKTQTQETDPWGLTIKPLSITGVSPQNYKFQNQEKIDDFGLNINWFKYRPFDPQTGRGWQIDRLAEKYSEWSPYAFSGNRLIDAVEIDGLEPHILFKTKDAAAKNYANHYNGRSILAVKEYAATIYSRQSNGKTYYGYNEPLKGTNAGAKIPENIPKDAKSEAFIHNHGAYEKGYDNNNFSPQDKNYAESKDKDIYVATPSGTLQKYDVKLNETTVVDKNIPSDPKDPQRVNKIDPNTTPKTETTTKIPIDIPK